LHIPLDPKVRELNQLPHTISYVIRKMQQIDNLNELPKEKRPPDNILWDGTSDDLDEWLEKVLDPKKKNYRDEVQLVIKPDEVEG
jgi:hypothetical protein